MASPPDFWDDAPHEYLSVENLSLVSAVCCYCVLLSGVAKRYHAELCVISNSMKCTVYFEYAVRIE